MEKTAVEWLVEKYIESGVIFLDDIKQSKEMEKKQIVNAFNDGYRSGHFEDHKLGSKYYEEYY